MQPTTANPWRIQLRNGAALQVRLPSGRDLRQELVVLQANTPPTSRWHLTPQVSVNIKDVLHVTSHKE